MTDRLDEEKWRRRFLAPDESAIEGDRYDIVNALHLLCLPRILKRLGCHAGRGADIGCGAGRYVRLLRGIGFDMLGIDNSLPMLQAGKQRAGRGGARFLSASAYQLPLRDMSQDLVISMGLLQLLTDVPRALTEMGRVLKPGATLLCETRNTYSILRCMQTVVYGQAYRALDCQLRHFSPRDIRELFVRAGFRSIRFHGFYVFPRPLHWVSNMVHRGNLDRIGNAAFPITNWLSHSFWVSAIRPGHFPSKMDAGSVVRNGALHP